MRICGAERIGGLLSANNIEIHTVKGYNYHTLTVGEKCFVIGGVPQRYAEEYAKTAAECDAAVLLTSKPEFTGGIEKLLDIKPDIEIYGGSAALRNIKEIVNRPVNEQLIKDGTQINGIKFLITPGLDWVDTVMVKYSGVLFSGEAFSGFDGTAAGLKNYYDSRLAVNKAFVRSAVERLSNEAINVIYPAFGMTSVEADVFERYLEWTKEQKSSKKCAAVVFSSEYGYTKSLAVRAAAELSVNSYQVTICDVGEKNTDEIADIINASDILIIGTRTINRNAPQELWNAVCRIDTVNKRGMPYFVFGSFGWAGDGIKLMDKTLAAMGLRRAAKPVEVLFKPVDKDFLRIDKAVREIVEYENINHSSNSL